MEFRILGPLEVEHDGGLMPLSSPREQRLLATLLLSAGRIVPLDYLVDGVWNGTPPPSAKRQVQNRLSILRRRLDAGAPIVAAGPGYRIQVRDDQLDALRFHKLIDQARALPPSRKPEAADLLRTALALWRGPALAGLTGWAIEAAAARLDEQRLTAFEHYVTVQLELGCHAELIGDLTEAVARHPTQERLVGHLMLALHRSARQADALRAYQQLRKRLTEELGLDPAPQLQELHTAILRNQPTATSDPTRTNMRSTAADPAPRGPAPRSYDVDLVPRQLPAGIEHFVGRTAELAVLSQLAASSETATAIVISAIAGTAGIGKTALAVHAAHRLTRRYPDGQLYVNLRGFDPTGSPMTPAEAIRGFLDAFAVPPQRIPPGLDAQTALYRSLLANRRVLVLLDNARDVDQVRPLLPGAPGCLVVVTSRNRLTSLVAAEAAHPITLDLLTECEARDLLSHRLGPHRAATEPHAVDEIITGCARLPLALSIVAARAVTDPASRLATLAEELRDARGRLDALAAGDASTDVQAVFSWSYDTLGADAAKLFRLLGLHPGPDISVQAAASLAGLPVLCVRPLLVELARAHLISEHAPGRHTLHDLLRSYAAEQSRRIDPDRQRHAATHRVLDHYLHTAHAAEELLYPARDPISVAGPQPEVTPEHLADHRQALDWFATEHAVLLAVIDHAASTGFDTHTWQLAWTLDDFLDRRGHWQDWAATGRRAVAAARRLANPTAQARAHRVLARAYGRLGRFDDAHNELRHALDLYRRTGDRGGQADTHHSLAVVWGQQGRHAEAFDHARQALELSRATGQRQGLAKALNSVGWYLTQLGDHERALASCQQALTLFQELDDPQGQANTWDSLACTHLHLGHHDQAIVCCLRAIALFRDNGDRHTEAVILTNMGDIQHATGDADAAGKAWQQALTILDELDHPDADHVKARLQQL